MIQTKIVLVSANFAFALSTPPEVMDRKCAEYVPYESTYRIEPAPNKDTMRFNIIDMEEITKRQNKEMINIIFENENTSHK